MIDRYQCEGDAFCQPIRCNSSSASHRYLIIKKIMRGCYYSLFSTFLPKLGSTLTKKQTRIVAAQQIMVHTKKWR